MPAVKSFAIWDRRPWLGNSVLSIQVSEPTDVRELRRWHRTNLYNEAAAALDASLPLPAPAEHLGEDYTSRIAGLLKQEAPSNKDRAGKARTPRRWQLALGVVILTSSITTIVFFGASWRDFVPMLIPFAFVIVMMFYTPVESKEQPKRPRAGPGLHASLLLSRHCADCGYNLAGAPPRLPIDLVGVNVGPRACPECGAPWPLVPPSAHATGVYPGPTPAAGSLPQS